eukprot:Phypoly_transcript_01774.p1 GENE.Phypoly_transcript_01774~~Phypoly_transcript_01774.p1  ORF type:complete len:943 (+),score=86.23 Phypoly_transcript_01774:272-3100(+)
MHAKKSHVIEAITKTFRWILVGLLPCDFAFTVALMTQPQGTNDATFEEEENLQVAAVHLATASLTALLSVICLFVVLPRFKFMLTRRMIAVFALRIVAVILLVPALAYPTTLRTTLNVIVLGLIFAELCVVCVVFVKLSKINRAFYAQKQREHSVGLMIKEVRRDPAHFIENLDDWLMLKDSRKMLRRKYRIAQTGWALACASILLIGFVIFVSEFAKLASTQRTLYSGKVIDAMNRPKHIQYFNNTRNFTLPQQRVLIVVLDGLRYDQIHINADMEQFFTSPEFAPHSKIFKMRVQLPSMSVPNWMTILTGAPPEATGVLGNLLVPETKFDSIFKEAQNFQLNRGLTGSPWFSAIVDSTLPFLGGDGTIPTSLGAFGRESSDFADKERANVARYAMTEHNYSLFLAHFSDIDIQGHCCGVTEKYNHKNTYYAAASNKTAILSDILQWLDNDTTLFIVSDHGHVDRGGHGGVDKSMMTVPLAIFKKNSYLADRSFDGPRFSPQPKNYDLGEDEYYSNMDLAPTICAILGIPVPRQSHGKFIDDAMLLVHNESLQLAYYDLYKQKQIFVQAYIRTAGIKTDYKVPNLTETLPLSDYVNTINELVDKRADMRSTTLHKEQARNVIVTTIIAAAIAVCFGFLLQSVTFCDPQSVFSLKHTWVRRQNRIAMALAFSTTLVYYAMSIFIYYIVFLIIGYDIWDSTVIHYPQVLTRYAVITLVPGTLVIYFLIRAIHVYYSVMPQVSLRFLSPAANPILFGRNPVLKDAGFIYLFRYYLSAWTVVSWFILIILQSGYTFIIPPVFAIKYITPNLWAYRFRVITVQLISVPLILTSIILLYFGLPSRNANKSQFDPIYTLKITKDFRHAGHPSTLENVSDNVPLEDPILLQHKNAIFYTAILQESAQHKFSNIHTIYDVTSINGETIKQISDLNVLRDKYYTEDDDGAL